MTVETCEFCGHSLDHNPHGVDQNDFVYDDLTDTLVHSGF